jgi:Family of unknown function (DUF6152)
MSRRILMLRRMIMTMAVVALVVVGAGSAAAHHGWSGYDSSKPLNLTGTILESGYEHPHGYLHLEVPGTTWLVVLAPPSRMENRGLPRTMLQAGTVASVEGYPHRNDPNEMRAERITIDGKKVELR